MRRRWPRVMLAAWLVVGAAACSSDDAEEGAATAPDGAAGDRAAAAGGAAADGGGGLPDAVPDAAGPLVVRTAELRLEVADFRDAFEQVTFLAGARGGFVVESAVERSGDELASGLVVIRVPAGDFDAVRKELAALGEVQHEQVKGEDVSAQLVDLEARLRNLRAQEEAMRALMVQATAVGETMQVQSQLFSVREQIEQLAAHQERLRDAVAFATIRVALAETGAAFFTGNGEGEGLGAAVSKAVDAAEAVLGALIVAAGFLAPLVLLGVAALLAWRLAARRRRIAAADG